MAITNVSRSVDLSTASIFLPHPAGRGIDEGYYIIYSASSATNQINDGTGWVKGYRWDNELPTSTTENWLRLNGTIQIVSESLSGSVESTYHGSNIIHIGPGVNDITAQRESDALFFGHMGQYGPTNQTKDEFYYWDRLFLQEGGSTWGFYEYHAHNPSSYAQFNNGRLAFGADNRSGAPGIEQYAHMIQSTIAVMGTTYQTVMARIHTPSVGGAHNSHNDVELPAVGTKNYMMGGIVNGTSDRFHAFYIAANGSDWNVFSRTFIYANGTFNSEINHGIYDLADPILQPITAPQSQSLYPVRASAGKLLGSSVYFPVLYRSGSTGTDVMIWSFESEANLSVTPTVTTLLTGSIVRPDCHLAVANQELYAVVSDITDGGVSLYKLSGSNWVDEGQIVTNNNGKYLRVHGMEFNPSDVKFYVMISGEVSGSGTTYEGPGVYSFSPDIPFDGYRHVDYVSGSNSFILRDALEAGYVQYDSTTQTLMRKADTEPQGLDVTKPVLNYEPNSPTFYEKRQLGLSGNEGFNHGIELRDGRQLFAGTQGKVDPDFNISYVDGIFAIYSPGDTSVPEYYSIGGRFDDYITGVIQSSDGKIYFSGFTKNLLVERRDLWVHGIGRGLTVGGMMPGESPTTELEYVDFTLDASGSQYVVGNHIDSSSILLVHYDYNFDLQWQKEISGGSLADTAHGISRDAAGNLYVAGKSNNSGSGNDDALLIKLNNSGSIQWTKLYGTANSEYASSVAVVRSGSIEYVLLPIVSGSGTTITALDVDGNIIHQNLYNNLVINRIRPHETTADGRFTFAGHNNASPTVATFGVGAVNNGTLVLNWVRTHTSASANTQAYDMRNTGDALEYMVVGTEGDDAFTMKVLDKTGTISRSWVTTTSGSTFMALANSPSTEPSQSRYTYVVGWTSGSQNPQQDSANGIISRFDHTGSRVWFNTLGHTNPEALSAIELDVTKFNVITVGKSRSHSEGQRGLLFRAARNGFGTGNHHLEGAPGMALWYISGSGLSAAPGAGSFNIISTPSNVAGDLLISSSVGFTITGSNFTNEIYEGSTLFDGYLGVLTLSELQQFKNTSNYVVDSLNNINHLVRFEQIGVAGDGQADDGNIFAYDVIELTSGSNAGKIVIGAQTSGDIVRTNRGGTGVYDYMIAFYTPTTDTFVIWQNGSSLDEEIYSITELANGDVAFVGRTDGPFGTQGQGTVGGYDIFTGIINPETLDFDYYTTGSGQADRGLKIHDISAITGDPEYIVVYETAGEVGNAVNAGPDDIGVITFNYETDEWGEAYQVGSIQSEFLDTLGNVSTLIPDGRLAIVGSSPGAFSDAGDTFGQADLFLAIFDIREKTWKKYQIGTGASDIGRTVQEISGNKLLIGGTTAASFDEPNDAISVLFDIGQGLKAKLS
jgi:hypothetical protein